ncbi:MAG: signal peptide peptidase SppA [Bacteroidales bacterium]|nr:signal peptide peptidase SppA [Bacteroidales bacterium]
MKTFLKMLLATIVGGLIVVLLVFFVFMGILGIIATSSRQPVQVKPNTVLHLKLNQAITDRSSKNPLEGFSFSDFKPAPALGLNDILASIKRAKEDPNIKGILLDLTVIPAGTSTVDEIREALTDFKTSGKFIISYADSYLQKSYYLASAADKVYLNPAGNLLFVGLRAEVMFYKNMLEKIGVEPQIIRHGKFKSAVEPYMLDKMSKENREQLSVFLNSVWQHMLEKISEARHVTVDELNAMADGLKLRTAEDALRLKMVDSLLYRDQLLVLLDSLSGKKPAGKPELLSISSYMKAPSAKPPRFIREKIAVVYASGEVISGEGQEGSVGSDRISEAIRKARKDSLVKAIVFRINSPGGSALASEVIWREVKLAAETKPVVVSMGDVAASGGYYIACPAGTIVANPTTITGSIGVFGLLLNAKPLLEKKIGITTDVARTNNYSDFGSFYRPLSQAEKEAIQTEIEFIYSTFVSHVAEGRKMKFEAVDSIGQGRIWSGISASRLGLVDELGGLEKAVQLAARKANLSEYRVVNLPELEDPLTQLMKMLSENTSAKVLEKTLGDSWPFFRDLHQILSEQGVLARMPFSLSVY